MAAHKSESESTAKAIRLFLSDGLVLINIGYLLPMMFMFAVSPFDLRFAALPPDVRKGFAFPP